MRIILFYFMLLVMVAATSCTKQETVPTEKEIAMQKVNGEINLPCEHGVPAAMMCNSCSTNVCMHVLQGQYCNICGTTYPLPTCIHGYVQGACPVSDCFIGPICIHGQGAQCSICGRQ